MESQTLQTQVIDAEKLQQLEEEIEREMKEMLNTGNIRTLLEKYGVTDENLIKIQLECEIELVHNQSDNQSEQTFLAGSRPSNVIRLQCCRDDYGNCIRC